MSELDWHTKLHHLRWTRLVLLMEKWFSLLLFAFFCLLQLHWAVLVLIAYGLAHMYFFAHNHFHTLEDAAGLPSNHLIVRY